MARGRRRCRTNVGSPHATWTRSKSARSRVGQRSTGARTSHPRQPATGRPMTVHLSKRRPRSQNVIRQGPGAQNHRVLAVSRTGARKSARAGRSSVSATSHGRSGSAAAPRTGRSPPSRASGISSRTPRHASTGSGGCLRRPEVGRAGARQREPVCRAAARSGVTCARAPRQEPGRAARGEAASTACCAGGSRQRSSRSGSSSLRIQPFRSCASKMVSRTRSSRAAPSRRSR